jgi:hypothetical protein
LSEVDDLTAVVKILMISTNDLADALAPQWLSVVEHNCPIVLA